MNNILYKIFKDIQLFWVCHKKTWYITESPLIRIYANKTENSHI